MTVFSLFRLRRSHHRSELPYDEVRLASSPDDALLEFLQSTYVAAADPADWDRSALERTDPLPHTKIPRR
jgi:hypothetical protein